MGRDSFSLYPPWPGGLTGCCPQAIYPADLPSRRIDELDEGGVLAEEIHFCGIDVLATRHGADHLQHLCGILARLGLVDGLQLDVHLGLRLHVGELARKG